MDHSKRCSRCGVLKPLEDFSRKGNGLQPLCRVCAAAYAKAWRVAYPERQSHAERRARLLLDYGLTLVDYDRMVAQQNGCCGLCGRAEPRGRSKGAWHVDHDHNTGRVRGLLCNVCNLNVGVYERIRNDPVTYGRVEAWLTAEHDERTIRPLMNATKEE